MKKLLTILTTATFFAIAFSLIDQIVWNNDFYWMNACIGFVAGAVMVLLNNASKHSNHLA